MRALVVVLIGIGGVSASAEIARADRTIRLGTVGKSVDRAAVEAALDGAFRTMTPCFRKASGTIKIKLEVGGDGEVVAATPAAKSSGAQCIAGLLAVTKFPAAAWKAEIQVDAVRPEDWLNTQLGKHQATLSACQDKDAAGKGEVALQLAIAKTGVVTSATVEKAGAGKAIADCARAAALKISLGTLPGGRDLSYRMVVTYAGGSAGTGANGTTTATPTGTGDAAGSARGALGGGAVQDAWVAQRGKVIACGAKMTKPATITVSFAVRANGTVKNVVFKDSAVGKAVEDCVDKELRAVKFPTANGETQVNLPISWQKK